MLETISPVSPTNEPNPLSPGILGPAKATARPNNIVSIVVDKKKKNGASEGIIPPSRVALIALTEKLAADAKTGYLKGVGGFALYADGYTFCLEGSYQENPEEAILPLKRLERQVMEQIEHED